MTLRSDAMKMITNFTSSNHYRAKIHTLIPGGAHTYSKGDDQFPQLSPAAIAYGKGAYLWDIDNNKYLDCAMGLTSVSLGHAYEYVIERVKKELDKGVNFQRPSYIEMEMAEKFLSLIPQHERIKFAKNGSTATTAAVKLARAYTGKTDIAFPKEQPFFSYDDWFIGSTRCNKGIPDNTVAMSHLYNFGELDSLENILISGKGRIAAVISEPGKSNNELSAEYLKNAIALAHQYGALFILDEMITGYKVDFPGVTTKYKLEPDMATWGKGIANGFSFCALTGKKEIMDLGGIHNTGQEKVFLISTTHGGETHAIAAGLATLEVFQNENVISHNLIIGKLMCDTSRKVIKQEGMDEYIKINDTEWFVVFSFFDKEKNASDGLKTVMMQEMIKRGVLFNGLFVPCYSHKEEDIYFHAEAFKDAIKIFREALENGYEKVLTGASVKPVFRKRQ